MRGHFTGRVWGAMMVFGLAAGPASATFHWMQIEQVIGGVNGDTTAQAIQLRQRFAGQNLVAPARMRAWDANGQNPVLIVDFTTSVPNGAAGARILIASAGFLSKTTPATVANFSMANLIPASYLAAGSLTFETDTGTVIYWRLSWGGANYTGPNNGAIDNDSDGNFGPPYPGTLPSTCVQALQFQGVASAMSTNNAANYALTAGAATFHNNAGTAFVLNACMDNSDCDDGIACTDDVCSGGCCESTPNDANCPDDGMFCNGTESCSSLLGCVSSGDPCPPGEICDEGSDSCLQCDDDNDCDDGVACTDDTCAGGTCVFTPNDGNCPDDGMFCNGSEMCHATLNCVSTGDPCGPGETCNEGDDTCDSPPIRIRLDLIASGLISPVSLTSANDGSHRLFVVDQAGLIRIIDHDTLLPTPFLDVTAKLPALSPIFDERGLLGLAFHPDYANNGRFFIRYSAPRAGDPQESCNDPNGFIVGCHSEVLAEYQVSGDPNVADPNSEIILFSVDEPEFNHNAGHVAFGPGGYLFFSLGDGGGANDGLHDPNLPHGPTGNGQNIDTALGSMLRIDVDSPPQMPLAYAIPSDNPFVGVSGLDEIYAYGFRNPYRFSFDRANADLYLADVGQDLYEEVNIVELGGNYGWVIREGFHCFDPFDTTNPPAMCATTGPLGEPLLNPVSEYEHVDGGLAVVGGYVYRGTASPGLDGLYIFGDFSANFGPTGRLYYFQTTGPNAYERREFVIGPDGAPLGQFLKGFGEDEDSEVYVLASDALAPNGSTGVVYRIAQCGCPVTPLAAPAPHDVKKNRYISFAPNNPAAPVAFKVTRTSPGPAVDVGWVGEPDANGLAQIVPAPVMRQWTEPVVHGGDCEIMPVATYEVTATDDGTTFSAPLAVSTIDQPSGGKFWGDTVGAFDGVQWTAPNNIVNANDFLAALQKFQSLPTAPHITVVDVQSVSSVDPCLNRITNIADVFILLQAFQGNTYPFTPNPASCPACP